ncbi:MAG: phosphoenolpyruvate carboxylase [Chromatocurvus sp.]
MPPVYLTLSVTGRLWSVRPVRQRVRPSSQNCQVNGPNRNRQSNLDDLRAIPRAFARNQSRFVLPGWCGLGVTG